MLNDFPNVRYSTNEDVDCKTSFENMHLKVDLLNSIYSYGFETPSAIQQRAIIPMITGHDVMVQGESRTGKSSSFVIAALQVLDVTIQSTQILCISPTGCLSQQLKDLFYALGDTLHIFVHCCIPGSNIRDDINRLDYGVHVVCGTPERLFHMSKLRIFRTRHIRTLILDGVDEMIHLIRFKRRIELLYNRLSPNTQVILTSSTLPPEVLDISDMLQRVPIVITELTELKWKVVKQVFVPVEAEEWKFDILYHLFNGLHATQAVVFCNAKGKVKWLSDKMREVKFDVCSINDQETGKNCTRQTGEACSGICRVFVTTDSGVRKIEMEHTSIVINYDLPHNPELFVERINRRFSGDVVNVNLVIDDWDLPLLKDIEGNFKIKIKEMPTNFADTAWKRIQNCLA